MARTVIPKSVSPGKNPTAGVTLTWTAADVGNGNYVSLTDKDVLLVRNVHASTTYTYTVTSVADERGRTGDITARNLATGVNEIVGNGMGTGWLQTNGQLYLDANNANIQFAVVTTV